jgi:hypothetical protein
MPPSAIERRCLRFAGPILDPSAWVEQGGLLSAAPELEVRLLERPLHGVRGHLLKEKPRQDDLSDPGRGLPLAGSELGVEVGEFRTEAGFPHAWNLARGPRAQPFRSLPHLNGCNTLPQYYGPRGRGQQYDPGDHPHPQTA